MALLLCIDTAMENAGVCLSENGSVVGKKTNNKQHDHATWIHNAINDLLEESAKKINELGAVAVVSGPGSYTGLRVGMATAKGLCYSLNIPLITESTLKIIAFAVKKTLKSGYTLPVFICPMIDARRMEVFTTLYDIDLKEVLEPGATILEENSFRSELNDNILVFCGNGSSKWQYICKNSNAEFSDVNYDITDLAILAEEKYHNQNFAQLAYTEPSYLKNVYTGLK
ncbi:MAG: tRNA (adenosine(37)-N6)-threonylcarbamoyltransferase complex dimerization subunit type 1 TsaB [Chitinophagaceae bacterium]|nr:tRNA (adenosine(37)-N6)-threonylcarbamoyltransferase complex dimerization subunit type 1 TsaB [Chitinophagaceae bacterium]